MKVGVIRTIGFESDAITGAGKLDDQINTWCRENGREKTFIELHYSFNGTAYTALLIYTE